MHLYFVASTVPLVDDPAYLDTLLEKINWI